MKTIDGLLVDLFGTLVPGFAMDIYEENLFQMAEILEVHGPTFMNKWIADSHNRGRGVYENIPAVISHLTGCKVDDPRVLEAAELRKELTRKSLKPKTETLDFLIEAKRRGLKMALVTNCSQEVPQLFPLTEMAPFFDHFSYSSVLGIMKPHERIYQDALRGLDILPANAAFIGDGDCKELTGATKVGMCAIRISNEDDDNAFSLSDKRDESDLFVNNLMKIFDVLDSWPNG